MLAKMADEVVVHLDAQWCQPSQYERYFTAPPDAFVAPDLVIEPISGDVRSLEGIRCAAASEPLGPLGLEDGADEASLERLREESAKALLAMTPVDDPFEQQKYRQIIEWLTQPEANAFGTHPSRWVNRLVVFTHKVGTEITLSSFHYTKHGRCPRPTRHTDALLRQFARGHQVAGDEGADPRKLRKT